MDTEKPILKRIQKLLTLSKDKGASKAEAERAMEMAQRLMTKYNITMANIENDTPASKIKHEYFFSRAVLNPADTEITAILCRFYKVKILLLIYHLLYLDNMYSNLSLYKLVYHQ